MFSFDKCSDIVLVIARTFWLCMQLLERVMCATRAVAHDRDNDASHYQGSFDL